ncbi:MAG TPA: hypothetical protein VKC59_08280, partial [Candidatus Limnocylindrales bacterium]|nr:hypothetical protein [Candidatus Limnocylindrales bacterium]
TINNPTSYWIARHSPKVFVEKVDLVSGVGYDRAAALGAAARFHEIRRVVTDLAVLDFETDDHRMRLRSVHPGVSVAEVVAATGFELAGLDASVGADATADANASTYSDGAAAVPTTRIPTTEELRLIREVLDPRNTRNREVPEPPEA